MTRRVSAGDALRIPAPTWNQLVGGLEQGDGNGAVPGRGFRQTTTCLIRNDTGALIPRFGVVGLGEPVFDPDNDETEFLRRVAFKGELAEDGEYELKWGIAPAPIPADEFGELIIQGLTYCLLDATDSVESAGPASDGDVEALVAADCGLARVLWRESGTGPTWAIVVLG